MFNPSEKQLQAIANMERFAWINSNKTRFESKTEFQKYFELLQQKSSKKSWILTAVTSGTTTFEKIAKAKAEKKDKYYANYEMLKNYWLNYLTTYFPTKQKLFDQLSTKTSSKENVEKVFNSIKHLINEEKMIQSYIDLFVVWGKNVVYIKTKLYAKKFDKELILKHIDILKNTESLLDESKLFRQILSYKNKWKSSSYVKHKFIEREEDKEIVEKVISEVFWDDWELENIKKELEKLQNKWFDKQKIITKLLSKWFKYNMIKNIL